LNGASSQALAILRGARPVTRLYNRRCNFCMRARDAGASSSLAEPVVFPGFHRLAHFGHGAGWCASLRRRRDAEGQPSWTVFQVEPYMNRNGVVADRFLRGGATGFD
jgi:hypothetical protein